MESVHKIKLVKPFPAAFSSIVFDAVSNMRCALDQAGYAIAKSFDSTTGHNAHFPFGDTLSDVQRRAGERSKDIPKEIFDVMVACKPYKGWNDLPLLWSLNKLCNSHKHEALTPTPVALREMTLGPGGIVGGVSVEPKRWDGIKNEMEFMRVVTGVQPNVDFKFSFFISIGNIETLQGRPALGVLGAMAGEVERVLVLLEREARRIGLIH